MVVLNVPSIGKSSGGPFVGWHGGKWTVFGMMSWAAGTALRTAVAVRANVILAFLACLERANWKFPATCLEPLVRLPIMQPVPGAFLVAQLPVEERTSRLTLAGGLLVLSSECSCARVNGLRPMDLITEINFVDVAAATEGGWGALPLLAADICENGMLQFGSDTDTRQLTLTEFVASYPYVAPLLFRVYRRAPSGEYTRLLLGNEAVRPHGALCITEPSTPVWICGIAFADVFNVSRMEDVLTMVGARSEAPAMLSGAFVEGFGLVAKGLACKIPIDRIEGGSAKTPTVKMLCDMVKAARESSPGPVSSLLVLQTALKRYFIFDVKKPCAADTPL